VHEYVHGCVGEWIDGWVNERAVEWMNGWMWINMNGERMYRSLRITGFLDFFHRPVFWEIIRCIDVQVDAWLVWWAHGT
jgi:hypothetical protein